MNAAIRRRIARAMTANGLSQVVTILIQVTGVPILLSTWGIQLYGEWLVLNALPAYLSLLDLGLCQVVANDMTMRVAEGDKDGALQLYQSTWTAVSAASVAVGALVVAFAPLLPVGGWLGITDLAPAVIAEILVCLSLVTLIKLQLSVLGAAYRCEGHYAEGQVVVALLRFGEFLAVCITALAGNGPARAAFAVLCLNVLTVGFAKARVERHADWLRLGFAHARLERLKRLIRPAIAYFGFPVGTALSLQGMVQLVSATLGAAAVVPFATVRTLTRLAFQLLNIVHHSFHPEISMAFGAGDIALARHLHRQACRLSLWTVVPVLVLLQLAGPTIVRLWTRGRIVCDPVLLFLLLAVVLANTLWYASTVVPQATNRHERIAWRYLLATIASLVAAWFLVPRMGLRGAALSLLTIDAMMFGVILRTSLPAVHDELRPFLAAIFTPPWRPAVTHVDAEEAAVIEGRR